MCENILHNKNQNTVQEFVLHKTKEIIKKKIIIINYYWGDSVPTFLKIYGVYFQKFGYKKISQKISRILINSSIN